MGCSCCPTTLEYLMTKNKAMSSRNRLFVYTLFFIRLCDFTRVNFHTINPKKKKTLIIQVKSS
jgi:hypothetical protein